MATQIEWDLPPGFSAGPIEWPTPQRFDLNSLTGFGYEGDVWLLALIYPTKILSTEAPVKIGANLRWVVCDDSNCVPGDTSVNAELPVSLSLPQLRAEWLTSFANARTLLPKKQWNLRALAAEGFVQVQIQAPDKQSSNYTDAEFFPEEPGIINPQAKVLLSGDPNTPGYYILTLKTNENTPAPKTLKGVLALRNSKKSESLNVELDVKASAETSAPSQAVAMTDLPILDEPLPISDPASSSSVEFEGGIALALLFAFMGGFLTQPHAVRIACSFF